MGRHDVCAARAKVGNFSFNAILEGEVIMEWNMRLRCIGAMRNHGGGFVKALALALQLADESNAAKIEAAFPEYIKKYSEIAAANSQEAHD